MGKLTKAQERALQRLARVKPGNVLNCCGHLKTACWALEKLGFAEDHGPDQGVGRFYTITPAGRDALKALEASAPQTNRTGG